MKILSGTSNPSLTKSISKQLKLKLINTNIKNFADGEIYVEINENIRGEGIETIENVIDRIKLYISKIISFDYKNILVVTHSGFLYALYKYINNLDLKLKPKDLDINFKNCCVIKLEINIIYDKMNINLIIDDKKYQKNIIF